MLLEMFSCFCTPCSPLKKPLDSTAAQKQAEASVPAAGLIVKTNAWCFIEGRDQKGASFLSSVFFSSPGKHLLLFSLNELTLLAA